MRQFSNRVRNHLKTQSVKGDVRGVVLRLCVGKVFRQGLIISRSATYRLCIGLLTNQNNLEFRPSRTPFSEPGCAN